MSTELVTIATFNTPAEASIVRNQLEAAGIRTFLADEATMNMAWHLGVAVGGVKLQVAERDAPRALVELESLGSTPIGEDEWRTEDPEDRSEADAEGAEEDEDEEDEDEEDEDEEDEADPAAMATDETVSYALGAAVMGLFLFPFQLYSLWLLARLVTRSTPLSSSNRRRMLLAFALDLLLIIGLSIWLWTLFSK
jgi:hypothetical protein